MTKKEIARKVLYGFSGVYLFYLTIRFFLGTATTSQVVTIGICYSIIGFLLILCIVPKIIREIEIYIVYKLLIDGVKYLQFLRRTLYKLYFTGDKEEIEKYSNEIERFGNDMINAGNYLISRELLISKKHINNVEQIIIQTEELMSTTN